MLKPVAKASACLILLMGAACSDGGTDESSDTTNANDEAEAESSAEAATPAMSEEERAAYMERQGLGFSSMDANSDGGVTTEEMITWTRTSYIVGGDNDGDGGYSAEELGMMNEEVRTMLLRADTDGDGAVTSDEFEARITARVEAADADGDGRVTEAEMQAAPPSS